jgi:hypothetical protein
MKKVMLVALFAMLMVSFAMAQSFVPGTDTLGAHNDGGRGCAGCHAPHSGGRGNGGDLTGTGSPAGIGVAMGDVGLWGQDLYAITAETLQFGNLNSAGVGYTVNFGGQTEWTATGIGAAPVVTGIALCLSCHDGQVSKGAMMMNESYEQQAMLLPNGNGFGATKGALYGGVPIPTLLGNDNGVAGDYANDHPVGPAANLTALFAHGGPGANLIWSTLNSNGIATNSITWTIAGNYATFVGNYGAPAVNSTVVDAVNQTPYVVCTTCHNQHIMNVYKAGGSGLTQIAKNPSGSTFATYFFINGPYNPGAYWTPTAAPSTTQFCRQCHFTHANEYYGVNGVVTAF